GCILDGKVYPYGEIPRTENCLRCSCGQETMYCCSLYHTPVGYDKEKCKIMFDKKTCRYDVVQKSDPSKECTVYSRV
ncbi:MSMB protein, partial [Alectura lathami]|nr:MSMB protein [Alectura lathami]